MTLIKTSLNEYIKNKEKYEEYDRSCVWVRLKSYPLLSFNIKHLPENISDDKYVIPTYYKDIDMFNENYGSHNPYPEGFVVEIDDDKMRLIIERDKINTSSKEYINIDEYIVSDRMHWFNQEVLRFLKYIYKNRIILTSDLGKTKSLLKNKVCSPDNKPIEYRNLLRLFEMIGVSDESFKKFIKNEI